MRLFIILALIIGIGLGTTQAAENEDLRTLLSLLGALRIGDDYETVKQRIPGVGALRKDAGENNTEALITTKIGSIDFRGEFNFSKGRLVSHGFRSGDLTHAQAHDFILRCTSILHDLYGRSERRVELPEEHDGKRDSIGISFGWQKGNTIFGLDLHYQERSANLQWGAQSR